MVRWDSPLITIPWSDPDIPTQEIWQAVTEGVQQKPNAGTAVVRCGTRDASLFHYVTTFRHRKRQLMHSKSSKQQAHRSCH